MNCPIGREIMMLVNSKWIVLSLMPHPSLMQSLSSKSDQLSSRYVPTIDVPIKRICEIKQATVFHMKFVFCFLTIPTGLNGLSAIGRLA